MKPDLVTLTQILPSTLDLLCKGLIQLQGEGDENEKTKQGTLRGGSVGIMLPDGSLVGKCARLSYLRMLGIRAEGSDAGRELMFAAGRTNEDSWYDLFLRSGIAPDRIRREGEVPILWTLPSGRVVTGRPDLVIGEWEPGRLLVDPDYMETDERNGLVQYSGRLPAYTEPTWKPVRGIEFKLISSLWTGRDVVIKGEPKTPHLIQAAHYSWKLGIPFELWYTNRVDFAVSFGKWPKEGEPGSEYLQYSEGKALKLLPCVAGYELRWDAGGTLSYRRMLPGPAASPWVQTIITQAGIQRYYETVDATEHTHRLPDRPTNLTPTGGDGSYSACKYCALEQVCNKREKGSLAEWTQAVKEWVPGIRATGSLDLGLTTKSK